MACCLSDSCQNFLVSNIKTVISDSNLLLGLIDPGLRYSQWGRSKVQGLSQTPKINGLNTVFNVQRDDE